MPLCSKSAIELGISLAGAQGTQTLLPSRLSPPLPRLVLLEWLW